MNSLFGFTSRDAPAATQWHVYRVDGTDVEVDLVGVSSVVQARSSVAKAIGVDGKSHIGIKLLNGAVEVCNDACLDSLDRDAGLCVVIVQGAPDWYPREKYMHDDLEVLQLTGKDGEYFAEFLNGSAQQVVADVYQRAVRDWCWKEVSANGRTWAHPPEKPQDTGGWTSFLPAGDTVRRGAVVGTGVFAGFLCGVTGNIETRVAANGDFGNAFAVAQVTGLVVYGIVGVARLFTK